MATPGAGSVGMPTSTAGPSVVPTTTIAQEVVNDKSDMEFTDFQQGPSAPAGKSFMSVYM